MKKNSRFFHTTFLLFTNFIVISLLTLAIQKVSASFGIETTKTYKHEQQNFTVYLPLVYKSVPETDSPQCRWNHTPGEWTSIFYKWGSNLQLPGSLYRNAFEASIADWSYLPTKIFFYFSSDGTTIIDTYSMQDNQSGYANITCIGSKTKNIKVYGNLFYEPFNDNIRRAYTGHEIGHAQSIGHILSDEISLMGHNPDPNIYFTPQQIDIDLIVHIYP